MISSLVHPLRLHFGRVYKNAELEAVEKPLPFYKRNKSY